MSIIVNMRAVARTLARGTIRDIGLVCLADGVVGASFGAISVSGGLPGWVPVVMSVLVFAGGAQFAAVGVVLAGGSAAAGVAAGLVLNTRFLPYGLAVADVLGDRWRTRVPGAHLIVDESVAFALRHRDPERSRAAFWACGLALLGCWVLAVVLGTLAGHAISDPDRFGLDAVFPAVMLALVLPSLSDRGTRRAALLGAAGAVAVTPFLPPGVPVLLALAGLVVAGRPGGAAAEAGPGAGQADPGTAAIPPEPGAGEQGRFRREAGPGQHRREPGWGTEAALRRQPDAEHQARLWQELAPDREGALPPEPDRAGGER